MADGKWKGEPTGVGWMMQNVFEPAGRVFGAASKANPGFYDAVQNKDNYAKKYGGEKTKPVPAATLDPKLYPDAVPGGYAITPQQPRASGVIPTCLARKQSSWQGLRPQATRHTRGGDPRGIARSRSIRRRTPTRRS